LSDLDPYRPPASEEPSVPERLVGRAPKPFVLWLVQGCLLLMLFGFAWGALRIPTAFGTLLLLGSVVFGGLVVLGLSWRWQWARWVAVVLMAGLTWMSMVAEPPRTQSAIPANPIPLLLFGSMTWFGLLGKSARDSFSAGDDPPMADSPAPKPKKRKRRRKREQPPGS